MIPVAVVAEDRSGVKVSRWRAEGGTWKEFRGYVPVTRGIRGIEIESYDRWGNRSAVNLRMPGP